MALYQQLRNLVFLLAKIVENEPILQGTAFVVSHDGIIATSAHVLGSEYTDLVMLGVTDRSDEYQELGPQQIPVFKVELLKVNPIYDVALLKIQVPPDLKLPKLDLKSLDATPMGSSVAVAGFPHGDYNRKVLTFQQTMVGAKVILNNVLPTKAAVLNLLSRPGQSGSPVIDLQDSRVVAMLTGAYVPGTGSGILLSGIDPASLHQTTHAISADYLLELLND